jgi:hypothetical protein
MLHVIRFRFELTPLDQVQPWGTDHDQLHWFALTGGAYWIELAGHELLRYSTDAETPVQSTPGFVDYYVARFWEDILEWTPTALEPVPADLVAFVASDDEQWMSIESDEAAAAKSWHEDHTLDLGYLRHPPRIRAWCTSQHGADHITMTWRHRSGSDIRFTASDGSATVTTHEFRRAVEGLDHDLMMAMADRVEAIARTGPPSDVYLDINQLRAEHAQRSTWCERRLARTSETDWSVVRAGVRQLRTGRPNQR